MRLLIMGPQGVGKGTQAALLSEHYGIPAISTGELTNKIVKDRLAMDDAKNGWILDGYPRNASQVEALDAILADLNTPLDAVVALDADHDVLMERMKKRAEIEGRSDDTPEAIAKRLDVYAKETAPLLATYEERGLLKTFNGVGSVEEIQATIVAELG